MALINIDSSVTVQVSHLCYAHLYFTDTPGSQTARKTPKTPGKLSAGLLGRVACEEENKGSPRNVLQSEHGHGVASWRYSDVIDGGDNSRPPEFDSRRAQTFPELDYHSLLYPPESHWRLEGTSTLLKPAEIRSISKKCRPSNYRRIQSARN